MSEDVLYGLTNLVPESKRLIKITPPCINKAIKNPIEAAGMRACHLRDGLALVRYLCWLEKQVTSGVKLTEMDGVEQLSKYRNELDLFQGLSFPTISASGPHGATIHYIPTKETDTAITTDQLYVCNSGCHYLDGTTDVTRTLHFGTPTDYENKCFTRVLKGQIAIGKDTKH